jgi:hypothetical protein
VGLLFVLTQPSYAQESEPAKKIRDISPDKKFAMRILYDAEENKQLIESEKADSEKIFSETIKSIELVSLPDKKVVANLLSPEELGGENNYHDITLIWSNDSKWCAFYRSFPRIGYTTVYKERGDKFVELNKPDELMVDVKGDVRNEYIRPIKWVKPAILLLEQFDIFRGGSGDATYQFTAKFDDKTGKFQITSKEKIPSKE